VRRRDLLAIAKFLVQVGSGEGRRRGTDCTTAPAIWTIALEELMPSFLAASCLRASLGAFGLSIVPLCV